MRLLLESLWERGKDKRSRRQPLIGKKRQIEGRRTSPGEFPLRPEEQQQRLCGWPKRCASVPGRGQWAPLACGRAADLDFMEAMILPAAAAGS